MIDGQRGRSRLLLIGDGLSAFGTWVDFIAILSLAAYQYRVSSIEMAFVSAAMLLPGILLAPLIGRLCDRGDPRRLLLASILLRVTCTAGVLMLHGLGLFILFISLRSVFASVAPPAINVMATRTLEQAALPRFYALLNVLNSAAKIVAPALGTISSSVSSEAFALVMSVVFSLCSLGAFGMIGKQSARAPDVPIDRSDASISVTPRLFAMMPLLWIAGSYAFFVFMVNNLVPIVLERGGFDKALLGVLVSCSGAGNILSGIWLAKRSSKLGTGAITGRVSETISTALFQAAGFGVIAIVLWSDSSNQAYILPLIFFFIGTFSARYAIALNVFLTKHYSQAVGAASGAVQSIQNVMILIAPMVGAFVLDATGGAGLFGFAAISAGILYAVFFALRSLRWGTLQQSEA